MTFQYNSNATYSTGDLASSNSTVELVTQKIYLNESESVQLNFIDILKDHEIIPDIEKNRRSYDGDSWKLSNKVFIALHSRKPKLEEYFHIYRCQPNFVLYCASSALGVSMQHLNHPNIRSVYRFHVIIIIIITFCLFSVKNMSIQEMLLKKKKEKKKRKLHHNIKSK